MSVPDGVSIVIPVRNGAVTLPDQLTALLDQADPAWAEIVVADNGSTDGTAAAVRARSAAHPSLRLVDASRRRGASHARNVGASAARHEKLLFCDADDVVAPGWITAMSAALDVSEGVGGRLDLLALNSETVRDGRGSFVDPSTPLVENFLTRPVGANCGVRRSVWEKLGGFDEDFLYFGDDTEFFWRLQLAGYQWAYRETAVVHYRIRPGVRSSARDSYRYGRTRPQLYRKFRGQGMVPASSRAVLGTWWQLGISAPARLGTADERGAWVRDVAFAWGKVAGSVKYRSWYL